jgi:hypothetical protein
MKQGKIAVILLLCASGVATGATAMAVVDTGTIPWSRALSAVLLLGAAVGAARLSQQKRGGNH